MPAGRPLEPTGNGRPRWMTAVWASPNTESGLQTDSSARRFVGVGDEGLPPGPGVVRVVGRVVAGALVIVFVPVWLIIGSTG